jgi:hypothetical protein
LKRQNNYLKIYLSFIYKVRIHLENVTGVVKVDTRGQMWRQYMSLLSQVRTDEEREGGT